MNSLAKSFKKMRHMINFNFTGEPNELFITLTFAKDSSDHKEVYKDCEKFMKKIRYKFKDQATSVEYINVLEPHASGQWHTHLLVKFNGMDKVWIPKEELEEIWGHGFASTKSLKQVDNIGAYLSAYLTDIELPPDAPYHDEREDIRIAEVDGEKKKFLKGARLAFYPTGMRIVRASRGIKKPEKEEMEYGQLKKVVQGANPNYSKTIHIQSEDYSNTITYEQYNLKRK